MSAYILTVPPFQNGPGNPHSQDTVMQDLLAVQPRGEEALGEDRGEWDPRVTIEEQSEGGGRTSVPVFDIVHANGSVGIAQNFLTYLVQAPHVFQQPTVAVSGSFTACQQLVDAIYLAAPEWPFDFFASRAEYEGPNGVERMPLNRLRYHRLFLKEKGSLY